MSEQPAVTNQQHPDTDAASNRSIIVVAVIFLVLTASLVAVAVFLALNPLTTGPSVRVVRDLMILVMALELVVVGVAVTVFLIQAARLINLVNNELQPLIDSTSDTINAVRGTAMFLSKNLADPVIQANSLLRGIGKIAGDVDAIRTAAGVISSAIATSGPAGVSPGASTRAGTPQTQSSKPASSKDEPLDAVARTKPKRSSSGQSRKSKGGKEQNG